MRTAYLGTSEFAATVLGRLASGVHRPALVVTPPDRARGRGLRQGPPPAATAARELGIECHQTESVNSPESLAAISSAGPEVLVVCAFGQLLADPLLSGFEVLNVHPSLLPRWRGAAPIERAIIAGDERTGVSIMRLTEGLDEGPVAIQEPIEIEPNERFDSLSARLAALGGELIVRALDQLEAGALILVEQDGALATYAEKIEREERRLDPARTAIELERVVRGLNPDHGTHLTLGGDQRLGVAAAHAVTEGPEQGQIQMLGEELVLGCAVGGLSLEMVQPPGGRAMAVAEYLRGHDPPAQAL